MSAKKSVADELRRLLDALAGGRITPDSADLLDDEQLRAKFAGMSASKFNAIVRSGPARGRHRNSRDFRLIDHFFIGETRYWRLSSYEAWIKGEI